MSKVFLSRINKSTGTGTPSLEQSAGLGLTFNNQTQQIDAIIATIEEAEAGTVDNKLMTPETTTAAINIGQFVTQLDIAGVLSFSDLATQQDAENATLNDVWMSPLRTKQFVNDQKGFANGLATLDANTKIPLAQLPDASKQQTYVVEFFNQLPTTAILSGDKGFVTYTGDSYIWDGAAWITLAEADWENVNLDYGNLINVPTTFTPSAHTHAAADIVSGTLALARLPIATQAQAEAGTDNTIIMTALRTAEAITAQTSAILTPGDYLDSDDFASQVEAEIGTSETTIMSPLRTRESITAIFADKAQAEAGLVNNRLMTPLRTAEAIAALGGGFADGVIETNNNLQKQFWFGTQLEYDAIGTKDVNTLYVIQEV